MYGVSNTIFIWSLCWLLHWSLSQLMLNLHDLHDSRMINNRHAGQQSTKSQLLVLLNCDIVGELPVNYQLQVGHVSVPRHSYVSQMSVDISTNMLARKIVSYQSINSCDRFIWTTFCFSSLSASASLWKWFLYNNIGRALGFCCECCQCLVADPYTWWNIYEVLVKHQWSIGEISVIYQCSVGVLSIVLTDK